MIRVLHVIDHLGLGGAQSVLLDLVAAADTSEVACEVAVMHGRGLFADALEDRGVKVHSLSRHKWPPAYVPNLLRLLRAQDYDILHFHLQASNWLAKPLGAVVSRARRVAHDHSSADWRFRRWWSLLPDALAHFFSHRVIAVSPGVADFLRTKEFVSRRKITVVANAVDTVFFAPASREKRAAARVALGLPQDRFVAGALGRLAPEKNFRLLARLSRVMPEIEFVVGGTGSEREAIHKETGGAGNFRLLGEVSDRPAFYAALDVLLIPSLHEALPMTLLEAMAAGVPVIASDLEGVASAMGGTGMLVAPGDAEALEEALRRVTSSPSEAAALAVAARDRAVSHYDARQSSAKLLALYRDLMK